MRPGMVWARQREIREEYGNSVEDYDGDALRRLTEEPILDAVRAFCPAGRLSEVQTKAREARQVLK